MKRNRAVVVGMLTVAAVACGRGDAPEPPLQEPPAAPDGVSGLAPAAAQGVPSVVELRPSADGTIDPPTEAAAMDQLGLAFLPNQLVVRTGQPLQFSNSESLAHNVHLRFIDTDSSVFIADMDPDDRTEITLEREGGYDVTCDVHPGMRAFIYVTSAPYAVVADMDGSFVIPDVPPGSYTAEVWSASAELRGQGPVDVSAGATELDLTDLP